MSITHLNPLSAVVAKQEEEIARLKDTLQFVERWANHHGQKAHMTPESALSCIQHYPPILDITRSYADGKVPDTYDPYADISRLRKTLGRVAAWDLPEAFDRDGNPSRYELEYGSNGARDHIRSIASSALNEPKGTV